MICVVCGQPGQLNQKRLNGLPVGVVACGACVEAVRRRQVGVVVRADGTVDVTDGRQR